MCALHLFISIHIFILTSTGLCLPQVQYIGNHYHHIQSPDDVDEQSDEGYDMVGITHTHNINCRSILTQKHIRCALPHACR